MALAALTLGLSSLLGPLGRAARGEDEVRISLLSGSAMAEVRGDRLALFDGVDGRRLWAFAGRGSARLARAGAGVEASGLGRARSARYGAADRLFVEAEGAVEVAGGIYFGRLEVRPDGDGGLQVLNRLPIETYLLGIVGSEMPPSWPIEALKAQAVAARTFALQRMMMARAADQPYDLAATVVSQVYKGAERIQDSVVEAVRATRGEVLAHDFMLAEALFHSTCGGSTLSSESYFGGRRAYLTGRSCEWCKGSSRYRWEVRMKKTEVEARLSRARLSRGGVREVRRDLGQAHVRVEDRRGKRQIDPRTFRKALGWDGLYSERFSARTQSDWVVFRGRGFGHGVGMCQWGAKGLAEAGRNYREILKYYYRGVDIKRAY